jgi:type III secretion system low calcium response chaperone LcrH/SycD
MASVSTPIEQVHEINDQLKQFNRFEPADLEVIYNLAYTLYNQGHYLEAEKAFELLCLLEPSSERFLMGLGAARQLQKNYQGAVLAYNLAAATGKDDPMVAIRAAECYLALGWMHDAHIALNDAAAHGSSANSAIASRIEALQDALG